MQKFSLEFTLHTLGPTTPVALRNSLTEFAEALEIADSADKAGKDFRISLNTEEPTVIFDICGQLGRIKSVRINEI